MKTTPAMLTFMMLLAAVPAAAQEPEILDVSDVVVGSQRLETRYAFALGKWSDAGKDVGTNSTQIHCYKSFGFCEVARAYSMGAQAWVSLDSFDVLRWDDKEMIAVDSSPICLVSNLRFDFVAKKVSLSSTSKGETKDKICASVDTLKTAFLTGLKDEHKRIDAEAKQKKK
ncbi:MAG: hypothetical protein LAO24_02905 [Acidobacteriia bacterium]|nr:hypothetical protein [Terriglobia bacterium]